MRKIFTYWLTLCTVINLSGCHHDQIKATTKRQHDLSEIATKTLDTINIGQKSLPDKMLLLTKLKAKNPDLTLTMADFDLEEVSATRAKLVGKKAYTGTIEVTYDSQHFQSWNIKNIPAPNKIINIAKKDNVMYLTTEKYEVYQADDDVNFHKFPLTESNSITFKKIVPNNQKAIYALTETEDLYMFDLSAKIWTKIVLNDDIHALTKDTANNIFVVGKKGIIYQIDDNNNKVAINTNLTIINSIAIDHANNIYVGSVAGLYYSKITSGTTTLNFNKINGVNGNISNINIDNQNQIYAVSNNRQIYKITSTKNVVTMTGITGKISCFAIDQNDNIYVAGEEGLYYSSNGSNNFTRLSYGFSILSLVIDAAGDIYVSSPNSIYKIKRHNNGIKPEIISDKIDIIWCLAKNAHNQIYAASSNGIIYQLLKQTQLVPLSEPINNNFLIRNFVFDQKNNQMYWISLSGKVYYYDNHSVKLMTGNNEQIASLTIDYNNIIYAGKYNGGVSVNVNNKLQTKQEITELNEEILSLAVDHKHNDIYVGTNKGVFKFDNKNRNWGQIKGVNNTVRNLLIDQAGNLFASTKNHVYYKPLLEHKQLHPIAGIMKEVTAMTIDMTGIVYVATEHAVYQYDKQNHKFNEMWGINDKIASLQFDDSGNLYAAGTISGTNNMKLYVSKKDN